MSIFFSCIAIIFLGILAGVLSASETAATASSKLRLHQLAKNGHHGAVLLLELQKRMATLISTILLVSMCLLSGMTALATQLTTAYMGRFGVVVAPLVMGAFITIYVEVMPKVYVYRNPEKVGVLLAPFLGVLQRILLPITVIIDKLAHVSLRFVGIKSPVTPLDNSMEELRGAIDLYHGGEGVVPHERAMLRSILDLSLVKVSDIMVHRKNIFSLNFDTPFESMCRKILRAPYTRIPIWKESPDNIVGVVNVKNLARALHNKNEPLSDISSLMKAPWFIPETTVLFSQLQLFRERHHHQAFVVDEYGSLLGMVTLEDILEEIVGEITDEYDIYLPGVRLSPDGSYLVHGTVTLRDLKRQYDWVFPDTHASTLAGLILEKTRTIPDIDTVVKLKDFHMKILRKQNHQITLVQVTPVKLLKSL